MIILPDTCSHSLFESQAAKTPEAPAVIFEDQQLTYGQLNECANRLARYLRTQGVGPERLVGIYLDRSPLLLVAMLATLKAGGAYVPLDLSYPRERLAFMLDDAQVSVLLTESALVNALPAGVKQALLLDSDWPRISEQSGENLPNVTSADNLAYVIYTSGSTGNPKGVMIPHRGLCNFALWASETFGLGEGDRFLLRSAISFDASVLEIYPPLISGAAVVMVQPASHSGISYLANAIREQRITALQVVPSLLRLLLDVEGLKDCPHLRLLICGGEALPGSLQNRVLDHLHARLFNLYGPTETSVYSTAYSCTRPTDLPTAPIGMPIANTSIHLLDADLCPVANGTPGELFIGGRGLARGYLNRDDLTAASFIEASRNLQAERLYRTGDLARLLPDGNLEFLGRVDHQVKIRGYRIELAEIEAALGRHPQVRECVVVARDDADGEKRLVAYITSDHGLTPSTSGLRDDLSQRLPNYMVPSFFVQLDKLPLTPSGKVDRKALPSPSQMCPSLSERFAAPRTPVQRQLQELWKRTLGLSSLGVKDDFFDLGGTSLLAVKMLVEVEQAFGVTVPPSALARQATIEQLEELITSSAKEGTNGCLVPIHPYGQRPPLFFVHSLSGICLGYRHLAHRLGEDQPFYGLQARGLDGREPPFTDIEAMAACYLKEVVSVQSQGPFFLGGYSFGGVVAFEMAQQLRARGEEVSFLAIVDEEAPGVYSSRRVRWREALDLSRNLPYWMADVALQRRPSDLMKDVTRKLKKTSKRGMNVLLDLLGAAPLPVGAGEVVDLGSLSVVQRRISEAHYQMLVDYRPRIYPGRIVLYRTRPQPLFRALGEDKGWGQLAAQGVEVIKVPGNHMNMIHEPYVQTLAQAMTASLKQAQSSRRSEAAA